MQAKIFAILAAAAVAVAQSTFQINTPTTSIIQCVPIQLTWTGGSAPYTLTVNAFANGAVTSRIESIGNVQSSPYSYTITAPVGTSLQFDLTDSRGAVAQSGGTPAVASGPSTSCLTSSSGAAGGASTSAAAGSSSSAAAGGASSSAAPSSSAAAGGSSSSSSRPSSSGTTSAPASATTSSRPNSAGSIRGVAGAVAGVVGIAAAALI